MTTPTQLAIGSRFKTRKGTFYTVGVIHYKGKRIGVDYVPDTLRKTYREEDCRYLSDELFAQNYKLIEHLGL